MLLTVIVPAVEILVFLGMPAPPDVPANCHLYSTSVSLFDVIAPLKVTRFFEHEVNVNSTSIDIEMIKAAGVLVSVTMGVGDSSFVGVDKSMPVTVEFGSNVGTSVGIGGGVKVAMSTARMGVFVGVGVYESLAVNGEQAERKIPSVSRLISFFMARIIRVSISRSIVS